MRKALAAVLIAALPGMAEAQERPQIFPTRDVAVTYRVVGQGPQAELTLLWSAAQRMMRINMPQGMGYMVADHRNRRGFMVMEQIRMVMDVPMQQAGAYQQDLENAHFTRGGTEKIAGHECTVWRYQSPSGQREACFTTDGVMLRGNGTARGVGGGRMEAMRVVFAPQDAGLFQRPRGYQTMQMPQGMPQGIPGIQQPR